MTVYAYRRFHDERDKRFNKLCDAMGYSPVKIVSGQLSMEENERDPHQQPKLMQLLERLQAGDVLIIEKLSDVAALPSKLPALLGKLSGTPATVFIAELSRHQPIEVYASVLSLSAAHFSKLEERIAFLEEELATTNQRVSEYVDSMGRAITKRFFELYEGPPRALVEGLMSPPCDLRHEEALKTNDDIVRVIEVARKSHGFSYQDLATLLGHSVSAVHRTCTTGRGPMLGDLIELLTRPRGPAPVPPARAEEKPNGPAPIDPAWKPAAQSVAWKGQEPPLHSEEE